MLVWVRAMTTLKSLQTTYKPIPSCASYFTSYSVKPTTALAVSYHIRNKLDILQIFVAFTHQSLGFSQGASLWDQARLLWL